ncbi:MAG: ribulose-phosphate 3-epimerase [Firmicutes bacterium]|nr:ribulose-phosphate 3-epimerase [Bacillota bacterium]
MLVSTSILSIKEDMELKLEQLNATDTDYIHLDVMDGIFVENKTEDYMPLKTRLKKPLDIHFMVEDVPRYIEHYHSLEPVYMTFHVEVKNNVEKLIDMIHQYGIKVGISLKPDTPVAFLLPYLDKIDMVLVMSVEPGRGGQEFLESANDKIHFLDDIRKEKNYQYLIEVDGGINEETKHLCTHADILVAGSFIVNHDKFQEQIDKLR